jgi:hypothetical protein
MAGNLGAGNLEKDGISGRPEPSQAGSRRLELAAAGSLGVVKFLI